MSEGHRAKSKEQKFLVLGTSFPVATFALNVGAVSPAIIRNTLASSWLFCHSRTVVPNCSQQFRSTRSQRRGKDARTGCQKMSGEKCKNRNREQKSNSHPRARVIQELLGTAALRCAHSANKIQTADRLKPYYEPNSRGLSQSRGVAEGKAKGVVRKGSCLMLGWVLSVWISVH